MLPVQFSVLCCALFGLGSANIINPYSHPNVDLGVEGLTSKYGYPLETHEVTTEDGYILTVHRIPHGKTNKGQESRKPVLLVHGILSSSVDWLNLGESDALGFMLAEQGYDVWMANVRGNTFSRKHETLDPDLNKTAFWDFSWHEMGYYDAPAMIDLILAKTGHDSLQYIGYSQGTSIFFVMATTRPEYNDKVKFAQLLAPVADMAHFRNPFLKLLAIYNEPLNKLANLLNINEVFSWSKWFHSVSQAICKEGKPTQELCKMFIWAIAGYDRPQLQGDFLPVILGHFPASSSLREFVHYGQSIVNKVFRQFDYGVKINLQKYGTEKPPKYDYGLITSRVALYYGFNDWLASFTDAQNVAQKLPNAVLVKPINSYMFNHVDFVWSTDIRTLVNNDVVKNLEIYN